MKTKPRLAVGSLVALVFFVGACASKPLKTSQIYPTRIYKKQNYKTLAFVEFDDHPKYREFFNAMNEYFSDITGKPVQTYFYSSKKWKETSDLALILYDIYHKEKILATQRRYWNMYFTFTLIDFWMIPLVDSTDAWQSELKLVVELELYDVKNDESLWRGEEFYEIHEKPTGFMGPNTVEFRKLLLKRASQNLAAKLVNKFSQYLVDKR